MTECRNAAPQIERRRLALLQDLGLKRAPQHQAQQPSADLGPQAVRSPSAQSVEDISKSRSSLHRLANNCPDAATDRDRREPYK